MSANLGVCMRSYTFSNSADQCLLRPRSLTQDTLDVRTPAGITGELSAAWLPVLVHTRKPTQYAYNDIGARVTTAGTLTFMWGLTLTVARKPGMVVGQVPMGDDSAGIRR